MAHDGHSSGYRWEAFNRWCDDFAERMGGMKPKVEDVRRWHAENAVGVWPDPAERPSVFLAVSHNKGRRVRGHKTCEYYKRYRAGKAAEQQLASRLRPAALSGRRILAVTAAARAAVGSRPLGKRSNSSGGGRHLDDEHAPKRRRGVGLHDDEDCEEDEEWSSGAEHSEGSQDDGLPDVSGPSGSGPSAPGYPPLPRAQGGVNITVVRRDADGRLIQATAGAGHPGAGSMVVRPSSHSKQHGPGGQTWERQRRGQARGPEGSSSGDDAMSNGDYHQYRSARLHQARRSQQRRQRRTSSSMEDEDDDEEAMAELAQQQEEEQQRKRSWRPRTGPGPRQLTAGANKEGEKEEASDEQLGGEDEAPGAHPGVLPAGCRGRRSGSQAGQASQPQDAAFARYGETPLGPFPMYRNPRSTAAPGKAPAARPQMASRGSGVAAAPRPPAAPGSGSPKAGAVPGSAPTKDPLDLLAQLACEALGSPKPVPPRPQPKQPEPEQPGSGCDGKSEQADEAAAGAQDSAHSGAGAVASGRAGGECRAVSSGALPRRLSGVKLEHEEGVAEAGPGETATVQESHSPKCADGGAGAEQQGTTGECASASTHSGGGHTKAQHVVTSQPRDAAQAQQLDSPRSSAAVVASNAAVDWRHGGEGDEGTCGRSPAPKLCGTTAAAAAGAAAAAPATADGAARTKPVQPVQAKQPAAATSSAATAPSTVTTGPFPAAAAAAVAPMARTNSGGTSADPMLALGSTAAAAPAPAPEGLPAVNMEQQLALFANIAAANAAAANMAGAVAAAMLRGRQQQQQQQPGVQGFPAAGLPGPVGSLPGLDQPLTIAPLPLVLPPPVPCAVPLVQPPAAPSAPAPSTLPPFPLSALPPLPGVVPSPAAAAAAAAAALWPTSMASGTSGLAAGSGALGPLGLPSTVLPAPPLLTSVAPPLQPAGLPAMPMLPMMRLFQSPSPLMTGAPMAAPHVNPAR